VTDPTAEGSVPSDSAKKTGLVRRLYDWVMHWADTPYGLHALAVITLAEASVFPIPPDPLLIALCLGSAKQAFRFAAVATIASVIGGMLGYGIGSVLWASASGFFFQYVPGVTPDAFATAQGFYDQWDFWAVFIAGLTPFPYKVITISAGVFGINFPVFIVASVVSRGFKYFVLAGLIYRFGDTIRLFIDRYFSLLAWAFALLVVGGFLLIEVIL
jgi:membrane protein YqaA with SNARE-associated domain